MTIDLDLYNANKTMVLNWFNTKGGRDIRRTISMMSNTTMVPCIVIAYWLGPETDWHPDVISSIKGLIDFYSYTNILNKPPGSPI